MAEHQQIYQQEADRYQRLVAREDYQGNLLPALSAIKAPEGLDIIDLGSGTGRLACLLGSLARSIFAFDSSFHMLEIGAQRLQDLDPPRWLASPDRRFGGLWLEHVLLGRLGGSRMAAFPAARAPGNGAPS